MDNHREKLKTYLEIHDELKDAAELWIEEFGSGFGIIYDVSITVNNEAYPPYMYAEYTYEHDGYGCGSRSRTDSMKIPLSVLWDDEAFERERKNRMEANLAAVKKKQEEDAKKERLAKAQRYEQYLDLCKEFEESG